MSSVTKEVLQNIRLGSCSVLKILYFFNWIDILLKNPLINPLIRAKKMAWKPEKILFRTQAQEMWISFARVTFNLPKEKWLNCNIGGVVICSGCFCHQLHSSSLEAFTPFTCTIGGWRTVIAFGKLFCLSFLIASHSYTYSPNSLEGFMDWQVHLLSTVNWETLLSDCG